MKATEPKALTKFLGIGVSLVGLEHWQVWEGSLYPLNRDVLYHVYH